MVTKGRDSRRRMASVLVFALVFVAIFGNVAVAAPNDDIDEPPGPGGDGSDKLPSPSSLSSNPGGSILGNFVAIIINSLANVITEALSWAGMEPIPNIVFNQNRTADYVVGDLYTESEWNQVILPWYNSFRNIAVIPAIIQIAMLVIGINIVVNPKAFANLSETFLNMAIVFLLLASGPALLKTFLAVNEAILGFMRARLVSAGLLSSTATNIREQILSAIGNSSNIVASLVNLNLAILESYFNIIYLVRKICISIMLLALPLVVWTWLGKHTRIPVITCISELLTNALMTTSHAIVLGFFLTIAAYAGTGVFGMWWAKLLMLNLIIPMAALLRKMLIGWLNFLGVNEERLAGVASAGFVGLAGLASLSGSVAAATGTTVSPMARSLSDKGAGWLRNRRSDLDPDLGASGLRTYGKVVSIDREGGFAEIDSAGSQGLFEAPLEDLPKGVDLGSELSFASRYVAGEPMPFADHLQSRELPSGRGSPSRVGGQVGNEHLHNVARVVAAGGKAIAYGATAGMGENVARSAADLSGKVGYSGTHAAYATGKTIYGVGKRAGQYVGRWAKFQYDLRHPPEIGSDA